MWESVVSLLHANSLILLFTVVALSYPLSKIRMAGSSLGIASVLFAGIFVGALDPRLKLPDIVYLLGLSVFIYAVGLGNAQNFWKAFDHRGLKQNLLIFLVLLFSAGMTILLSRFLLPSLAAHLGLMHWDASQYANGFFNGSLANSAGLAMIIEHMHATHATPQQMAEPVVAYSITYPLSVLVPVLVMLWAKRFYKVDLQEEAKGLKQYRTGSSKIAVCTVQITHPEVVGFTKHRFAEVTGCMVVWGRIHRNGQDMLPRPGTTLQLGDMVVLVATPEDMPGFIARLGEESPIELQHDISELESMGRFVSNPKIIGLPLAELHLAEKHDAIITRLRRGDAWFIPNGSTILQLGDRIRVLTHRENHEKIDQIFGNSYRELSEVDFLSFSMGLAAGLALGMVPIPLPGGITFHLGFAGGPLVMALFLGKLQRSGSFVWSVPYSANLTIRQFGLLLFAAGLGTTAGEGFAHIMSLGFTIPVLVLGAGLLLAVVAGMLTICVGYKLMGLPMNLLLGILAGGTYTQGVALGFANEQAKNDIPSVGYVTVYPLATILKIILTPILIRLL